MFSKPVRFALLAGVLVAAAGVSAQANDCCAPAPCTRTVCCTEWVPEQYPCTRTVYKTEYKQETYTAYRCESIPETKTYNVTVYKSVPEVRTETRNVCTMVPVVEERTIMKAHVSCVPVTTTCRRCVDRGHYECREVPVCENPCKKFFSKLCSRKHDCCEPCCEPSPPPMKTVQVWVPCKVWEEYPVTTYKRVCEYRPEKIQVTCCKPQYKQEQFQVTCMKCVPEVQTRTCTIMTSRMVPYQATRTVCVCVPHQETFTATRMVARTVTKEVPVCAPTCCETVCCKKSHKRFSKSGGLCSRSSCCD
jgi:hypothetical protein